MSLTLGAALGLGAGSAAVNLGGSFLGSLFNKGAAEAALEKQVQASKDLLDYQMEKYSSPLAQMKQIGKAGLNPAAMFGNTAPVNVGGSMAMPNAPTYGIDVGTQSLSDVASLLVGAAQAKKAGADTKVAENAAEGAALDNERKTLENDFMKRYGLQKSAAELALAQQNVKLALASTDVHKQEKALKEWQSAKEKALSECSEKQRDLLQKELDNKDTEIRLRNEKAQEEIKTEQSAQSANYASADSSRASASNFRQQARVNSVLADIQEATSKEQVSTKLAELVKAKAISDTDAEQARQKLEAISNMRDGGTRQKIDDFLIWLKDRINILK